MKSDIQIPSRCSYASTSLASQSGADIRNECVSPTTFVNLHFRVWSFLQARNEPTWPNTLVISKATIDMCGILVKTSILPETFVEVRTQISRCTQFRSDSIDPAILPLRSKFSRFKSLNASKQRISPRIFVPVRTSVLMFWAELHKSPNFPQIEPPARLRTKRLDVQKGAKQFNVIDFFRGMRPASNLTSLSSSSIVIPCQAT